MIKSRGQILNRIHITTHMPEAVGQAIPDAEERIQYGKPHFLKNGAYAAVIMGAKKHVSFTIFNAKQLAAPEGLFEPGNSERKTIKIKEGQAVDYSLLTSLLEHTANTL